MVLSRNSDNKTTKIQGSTLVETLIYMSLLAILLVILTEMFVSILNIRTKSAIVSSVEQDGRYIISHLRYDAYQADSILLPEGLGAHGTHLELDINGVIHSFTVSSGILQVTNDLGVMALNSSETQVSDISFQRVGNLNGKNMIKVQFTVTSIGKMNYGQEQKVFQTMLGVR